MLRGPGADRDVPAGRSELHRVGEEVDDALPDLVRVDLHLLDAGRDLGGDGQLLLEALRQHRLDRRLEDVVHVHHVALELHAARLDAREVEDGGDQPQERFALVEDGLEIVLLLVVQVTGEAREQHLAVADHAGERRAQLVRDGGEEVRLEAGELLQPLQRVGELLVLLLHFPVALGDALDVELRGDERLVRGEDQHVDQPDEMVQHLAHRALGSAADAPDQVARLGEVELALQRLQFLAQVAHVLGEEGPEDDAAQHVPFVEDGQHEIPQPAEAVAHRDLRLLQRAYLDVRHRLGAQPPPVGAGEHVGAEIAAGDLDVDQLGAVRVEDLEPDLVEIDEGLAYLRERGQVEQLAEDELLLEDALCHAFLTLRPPSTKTPRNRGQSLASLPLRNHRPRRPSSCCRPLSHRRAAGGCPPCGAGRPSTGGPPR